MSDRWFAQEGWRVRMTWGRAGAQAAAEQVDILVVVDVLSFSTAVATAVQYGGVVQPCLGLDEAEIAAKIFGGVVTVRREEVPAKGRFSLSPRTFIDMEPGTRVCLPSPNGATCCNLAHWETPLFVGALVNAEAVGAAVSHLLAETDRSATILACGERWQQPTPDGDIRFAIEDYLGAGAILAALDFPKSPEAHVCEAAFTGAKTDLAEILWNCGSGIELRERGFGDDVRHAAQLNRYTAVPHRRGNTLRAWTKEIPKA